MEWKGLPTVIVGSSGMAKETYHLIKQIHQYSNQCIFNVQGFVDNVPKDNVIDYISTVTDDDNFYCWSQGYPVIGIVISLGDPKLKKYVFEKFRDNPGAVFPNLIYPEVLDCDYNQLGFGNIMAKGANMTCNISIGNFNLLNRNCNIGHDTIIGDFNTINPGATISGNVVIGDGCLIGTGANILQGIKIGDGAIVGAGSVVTKDVPQNVTVVGVPAKEVK